MGPFEFISGVFRFIVHGPTEQKPPELAISENEETSEEEIPDDIFQPNIVSSIDFDFPAFQVYQKVSEQKKSGPWSVKYTRRIRWNSGEWEGTRLPKIFKNGQVLTGDDYNVLAANLGQSGPRPKIDTNTGLKRDNSGNGIVYSAIPVELPKQVAFKCPKGWWRWHPTGPEPLSKSQQKKKWEDEGYPSEWTRFKTWVKLTPKEIKIESGKTVIYYDWDLMIGRRYYTELSAGEAAKAFISGVYQWMKKLKD